MLKKMMIASSGFLLLAAGCGLEEDADEAVEESSTSALAAARNPAGVAESFHTTGAIDRTNPFFRKLGANDRTCETCHGADQGWSITAAASTRLFFFSGGLAPLFMTHDAGSRPDADLSKFSDRFDAFASTLLKHGATRFLRTIPATAEFTAVSVKDPYGFSTPESFSSFRRPSPTMNEAKVAQITHAGAPNPDMGASLAGLVRGAAQFHGQRDPANPVPVEEQNAARDFQLGLFFAQICDKEAGRLDAAGAKGGPAHLANQEFYVGINDIQGMDPGGRPFTSKIFNLFDAWDRYARFGNHGHGNNGKMARARAAIYRGQEVFNSKTFKISGVTGLNDRLGRAEIVGTCGTCHNAPNIGGHSVYGIFDIGTADAANCSKDFPLITVQNKTTMKTRTVCDLGRATGSGLWKDIGGFRAPPLRGLAARAPYFHDGAARDIEAVIDYHNKRFKIGLSKFQKKDLEAFLSAL